MLTARGWWFFAVVVLMTTVGVAGVGFYSATVPILGLTLLAWFLFEWAAFAARFRAATGRIEVRRELLQGGRTVPAAWTGATVTVRVTITLIGGLRLPFAVLRDRPPVGQAVLDGSPEIGTSLRPDDPIRLEYTLKPSAAGVLRFEGVQFRVADLAGFFYRRAFLRVPVEVLVLPALTDDEGHKRGNKRFNTLPPPGVHRLRRPGGGNELLDLREYRPGDPPKMIAWKASARRDRLITKEFESDVPVRCVLFLDASNGVRHGSSDGTSLARLAAVAAGVAQAAAASRDLVGLSVFDDDAADFTAPSRSRAHLIRLMRQIADATGRLPRSNSTDPLRMARHAYPLAQELYPDLLAKEVNSRPFGLFWLPIADSRWLWVVIALAASPMLLWKIEVLSAVARVARAVAPQRYAWAAFLLLIILPGFFALITWFVHGVRGLFPSRSRQTSQRKQLAALYAVFDGTGAGGVERYLNDDDLFAARCSQFLQDHRLPPPWEPTDPKAMPGNGKIAALAGSLTRAVARAHDNELYVVLADLSGHADLTPLLAAARMARARHHHLLVIVPWPADVPPPGESPRPGKLSLKAVICGARMGQYHRDYATLRTELGRLGVPVVRVEDGDPVRRVLERLDRLRGVRVR